MAKLIDKLMNRVIKGKLTIESGDDVSDADLSEVDLHVKSINAKGGAISGPLAVTGNTAIGGALDVNGDSRAKTLSQSEANFEDNNAFTFPTGFENITGYKALKLINGVLWIILSISFTTGESYTEGATPLFYVDIPESLRDKIFDVNGKNMNDSNPSTADIYCFPYVRLAGGQINTGSCRLQNASSSSPRTKLNLQFYGAGWQASQNNNEVFLRIPLLVI